MATVCPVPWSEKFGLALVWAAVLGVFGPSFARADERPWGFDAHESAATTRPGGGRAIAGAQGLPALHRVPVAGVAIPGIDLAAGSVYGFTEAVLGDGDTHHRFGGTLAGAVRIAPWLAASVRTEGRIDRHSGRSGNDWGALGELGLSVRFDHDLSPTVALGAQAALRLPGRDAPSLAPDASTLDLSASSTWRPSTAVALVAVAGFRVDYSARALARGAMLSPPDRLALGASDSNAVLAGFGMLVDAGEVELFAELSADLLVGRDAPPLGQSPLRAALGGRLPLARLGGGWLTLGAHAEGALSARPGDFRAAPDFPIEPRISLGFSMAWRVTVFGAATARGSVGDAGGATEGATVGDDARGGVSSGRDAGGDASGSPGGSGGSEPETVGAATGTNGAVRGVVRTRRGSAVAGARVRLQPGNIEVRADVQGAFEVEVAPGPYVVEVRADGLRGQRRSVRVEERGVTVLNLELDESR
jgi:hypothetical protein